MMSFLMSFIWFFNYFANQFYMYMIMKKNKNQYK